MATQEPEWTIEFYIDARGRSEILEFINGLPVRDRARVRNALRLLREFGVRLSMPHARHIEGNLWELRPGAVRLFYCARRGRCFVVLHGIRKTTPRTPRREIDTAMRRMSELLEEDQ